VKTQPLPQHAKAKQKEPSTSPLCGKDQGWCRNRYARRDAGSIKLCHEWPADLADEPLAAALFNVPYERSHQQRFADGFDTAANSNADLLV
jgi:hypothetical protein